MTSNKKEGIPESSTEFYAVSVPLESDGDNHVVKVATVGQTASSLQNLLLIPWKQGTVDKMYNLLKMGPHIVYAEDPKTL
jgi:hypothetical protein